MNRRKFKSVAMLGVFLTIGALIWIGFDMWAKGHGDRGLSRLGLKLVAKYEPLHLCIYADVSSTNKYPDYLVCEGKNDVFYRRSCESNAVEDTHFENGDSVLVTRRDLSGKILMRTISYEDNSGRIKYTYIDSFGDGLWNIFCDNSKGIYYIQSNLCWVIKSKDK